MEGSKECPFLQLPTELRLLIYGFALLDSPAITIGTAELKGAHPDIVHRLYGNKRSPYDGLPRNHEPVIETRYNSSLLSVTNPAIIPLTPATSCPPEYPFDQAEHRTHCSLLQINKQVQEELTSHFQIAKNRRSSLFVSYPHGLHIMQNLTKPLIQHAKSVHIAGAYQPRTFSPRHAAAIISPREYAASAENKAYERHAKDLGDLVSSLFGPHPEDTVRILELRIYYPGADSYSTVWGDESSPTVVALRNIYCGEINIEVWRGRWGTGVYLTVKAAPAVEIVAGEDRVAQRKKRIVSTVWRRLEEGRRGDPECGTWVVDPIWPECRDMLEAGTEFTAVDVHFEETLN